MAVARLRGEQHQQLLVLGGERGVALLLSEEEVPEMRAAVAHRGSLQGLAENPVRGVTERADVAGQVVEPHNGVSMSRRCSNKPQPFGQPTGQLSFFLRREARGHEVQRQARLGESDDHPRSGRPSARGPLSTTSRQHGADRPGSR